MFQSSPLSLSPPPILFSFDPSPFSLSTLSLSSLSRVVTSSVLMSLKPYAFFDHCALTSLV